jgi:hypothetical protein
VSTDAEEIAEAVYKKLHSTEVDKAREGCGMGKEKGETGTVGRTS